jgi:hypothetical protein
LSISTAHPQAIPGRQNDVGVYPDYRYRSVRDLLGKNRVKLVLSRSLSSYVRQI